MTLMTAPPPSSSMHLPPAGDGAPQRKDFTATLQPASDGRPEQCSAAAASTAPAAASKEEPALPPVPTVLTKLGESWCWLREA